MADNKNAAPLPETTADQRNPLWDSDLIQFARLLDEIRASSLPESTMKDLMDSMDLARNDIIGLFERATLVFETAKLRHCSSHLAQQDDCDCCNGRGYLFPHGEDTGFVCVEKCDNCCSEFTYDDEAAGRLRAALMELDPEYCVAQIVLPGMEWKDCGSVHFVVLKDIGRRPGAPTAFRPIDFDEATELAVKLGIYTRAEPDSILAARCCPTCGGTDLVVQLPAMFAWDGKTFAMGPEDLRSCEFPIEEDAMVICNGIGEEDCDFTCKVAELKLKK